MIRFLEDVACCWAIGIFIVASYCAMIYGALWFVGAMPDLKPPREMIAPLLGVGAIPGFGALLILRG